MADVSRREVAAELERVIRQVRRHPRYYNVLMHILHEDDRQLVERIGWEGADFLIDEGRWCFPLTFFFQRLRIAMEITRSRVDGKLPDITYLTR
jgi:hypothetical protein